MAPTIIIDLFLLNPKLLFKKNINGSTSEITDVIPAKNKDVKNAKAKKFPSKPSFAKSVGSEINANPAPFDGSEPNS